MVRSFLQTPLAIGNGAAAMHERPGSGLNRDKRAVARLRRFTVPRWGEQFAVHARLLLASGRSAHFHRHGKLLRDNETGK